MNISNEHRGIAEEWLDASLILNELKDDVIPQSQTTIEWNNSSEDEHEPSTIKKKALIIRPNKTCKNQKLSSAANEKSKSPVFKVKLPKKRPVIDSSENEEKKYFNHSPESSVASKSTAFANMKTDNQTSSVPTSPVFKSRLKKRKLITQNNICQSSRESELKNTFRKKKAHVESNNPSLSNANTKCSTPSNLLSQNIEEINNCLNIKTNNNIKINLLGNCKNKICHVNESIKTTDKNKSFLKFSIFESEENISSMSPLEENNLFITDCPSPIRNNNLNCHSSTSPSIESENSNRHLPLNIPEIPLRGSDWIKELENKTNQESQADLSKLANYPLEQADSTKKKIRKDGLAHQLRKLLHSWQSNVSMWDHQMSLALFNQEISCSLSPQNVYLDSPKLRNTNGVKHSHLNRPQKSFSSCLNSPRVDHGQSIDGKLTSQFLNSPKKENISDCNTYSKLTPKSPIISCRRSLKNSLEIASSSPSLPSGLSSKTHFSIPEKHLCVKVIKIEWQTSVMISAICRETDDCSRHLGDLGQEGGPRRLLGMFGCMGNKPSQKIQVGSSIKIFAPWQLLGVENGTLCIFSSYYLVTSKGIDESPLLIKTKKEVTIASWQCSCISESHVIPSTCSGGKLNIQSTDHGIAEHRWSASLKTNTSFNTVKESSPLESSPKNEHYWTVLEAIEQCGGMPDIPVSVTVRIRRVYPMKLSPEDSPSHFLILGQDPSGVFLLVEVPNRPLKSTLKQLLSDTRGSIRTLTHLSVVQRIIDSEHPGLFSVIHSLQTAFNQSVSSNPRLWLLKDQANRPRQAFCYKFAVNLGQTLDIKFAEAEGVDVALPRWTIREAQLLSEPGLRGCVAVNILYYIHPYIHVMGARDDSPGSENQECHIYNVNVNNATWLPAWMNCDGTIMTSAVIEDVAVGRGCLFVDEFSRIQRIKGDFAMSLSDLLPLIPKFRTDLFTSDLVWVQGPVRDLDLDKSLSWIECSICGSHDLYRITETNIKCQECQSEHIEPVTKYSVEVCLGVPEVDLDRFRVRVKLFQATIRNVLKSLPEQDNKYEVNALFGARIGPLVCSVKSVERKKSFSTFLLVELPY